MLIFKTFKRSAKINPNFLSEDEWIDCLKQKTFSVNVLRKIEGMYIPTLEQYQNASDSVGQKYFTENQMLMTFL
jgi:hypothetical protein